MKKLLLILLFFSSCSQYTSVIKYGFPKDPYTQKKSKSFNELKNLEKWSNKEQKKLIRIGYEIRKVYVTEKLKPE